MKMKLATLGLIALLAINHPVSARELWLIGGGADPVCDSTDIEECLPERRTEATQLFDKTQAFRSNSFHFDQARRDALYALPRWNGGETRKQILFRQFDALKPQMQDRVFGETQWHELLQAMVLTEDELQLFDDAFEVRPLRDDGTTQRDTVYLGGSDGKAQALYRSFVALATKNPLRRTKVGKPRLLILTSSSNNVFGSVDYYLSLFEQAGAEVQWLPLEPGFVRTRDCHDLDTLRFAWNGAYDRAARYPELAAYQLDMCLHPEKMRALIESADGIFINGGDQSLTLRTLQVEEGKFTDLATLLLARVDAGVPLGGTSAGTASQSGNAAGTIPMISDGNTSQALRYGALAAEINAPGCPMSQACTLNAPSGQLTYRAIGGLRTFDLGVLDTHFFQRQREGRLVRLLIDSKSPFGFGVDASTVLHMHTRADGSRLLNVQGDGGVWIVDVRDARVEHDTKHWSASGFHASLLLDGDSAVWKDGFVSVSIDCPATSKLATGTLADSDAFKAHDGREWQALDSDQPVPACRRSDGRWHYVGMPLRLTQSLD